MSAPPPSRVLMTADTVGGVWTFALDLCRELARRNVEVWLLSMGKLPDTAQQDEAGAIPNLRLVPTSYRLEWMQDCEDDVHRSGHLLLQLARELRPDVVHLNGYCHASLSFDAPVVVTAHSCVSSWWRACKDGEPLPRAWRQYETWVEDGVGGADLLTAPTAAFLAEFERLHGRAINSRVIHNGRSAGPFAAPRKENVVFAAGRLWDEAKNVAMLADIAAEIDAPILVAGDHESPDGCAADLGKLKFLGRLTMAEMFSQLSKAAVFASPARYEPFGLTVLEAALSSCALVLSDIPTLRELWEGAALFVHPDDGEGWKNALSGLLREPARAAQLGRQAREHACLYSASRMADEYLEAYGAALAGRMRAPIGAAA